MHAVELAELHGFAHLKMYFMIGQPTETEDDIHGIVRLVLDVRKVFGRNITINATPYIPKAHTPFQWAGMAAADTLKARLEYLRRTLGAKGVDVRSDSVEWAMLTATLSRGDARLGHVLARMEEANLHAWADALEHNGLSQEHYLRERHTDERLPWEVVDMGAWRDFRALRDSLEREWRRATGR